MAALWGRLRQFAVLQWTVCSWQLPMCSIQFAVGSCRCAVFSLQWAVAGVQSPGVSYQFSLLSKLSFLKRLASLTAAVVAFCQLQTAHRKLKN
jgi:hypothetical protein